MYDVIVLGATFAATDDYYRRITQKPKHSSEGNMVQTIKVVADSTAQKWKAAQ